MKLETTAEYFRSAKILFRLIIGAPALQVTAGLANDAELESGCGCGVKQRIKIIYNPDMDRGGRLAWMVQTKGASTPTPGFEMPGYHRLAPRRHGPPGAGEKGFSHSG